MEKGGEETVRPLRPSLARSSSRGPKINYCAAIRAGGKGEAAAPARRAYDVRTTCARVAAG